MILVTLVCCYVACWGPTKKKGISAVTEHVNQQYGTADNATMICPLLICVNEWDDIDDLTLEPSYLHHRYYFWFFGYVAKLHERPSTHLPLAGNIFREKTGTF